METAQFVAYLEGAGVNVGLAKTHPVFIERLAGCWKMVPASARVLELAFIGRIDGPPLSVEQGAELRKITALHAEMRAAAARRAPREALRAISEERAAECERDQMPVTASMAGILKEAQAMIGADNLAVVGFLRSHAIDLNQKDRDGLTPIAVASQFGADKSLFALCKGQANPHVSDALGNTPLHWSCAMEKPKAASVLLYHGANPNAVSHNGVTPLMLAVSKGNLEMAQKLLEYGAELRMADRKGNTVLHRAVMQKNVAACRFLLACGANMEEHNQDGVTPLGLAMRSPELAVMFCDERERAGLR